jgi:hypothetical protein
MSDQIFERIAVALEKLVERAYQGAAADVIAVVEAARGKKKAAPSAAVSAASSSPAAGTAPPATAQTSSPAPTASTPDVMTSAAEAVIDLANNYSRETAVGILAKYGAQKVSQVKMVDLPKVLGEAQEAIKAAKASKANESLV